MEGEAIMICIDTSRWMTGNNSHMFKEQADAVRLYCTEKFKSHPETVVGICGLSNRCISHLIHPARDIWQIMRVINEVSLGGYLMLLDAVMNAYDVWFCYSGKELGKHLPKRIVVFAGGPLYEEMGEVQILGKGLKDKNVACDAISFGDPARNKQKLFETLIALADNNGNCNHLHVPPKSSVRAALSRSKIIRSGSAPLASLPESSKQNINALSSSQIIGSGSAPLASLPVQQESSKQNINAVPRYLRSGSATYASLLVQPESSKQNINALSSSQIIGSGSAPLASLPESSKQNINALSSSQVIGSSSAPLASLPVQQESSKQNINAVPRLIKRLDKKAAANYPESVDPHDYPAKINALSQSVVDLKLENVKPNSQPETLDERIERVKQDLESLLMQKQEIDMASFTGVTTPREANNATQKSKQEMKKKKKKKKKKNKQVAC